MNKDKQLLVTNESVEYEEEPVKVKTSRKTPIKL